MSRRVRVNAVYAGLMPNIFYLELYDESQFLKHLQEGRLIHVF